MDIIQNKYYILSLSLSIVIGSLEPKTRHVAYQLPHLVLLCHTQPNTVARALVQSANKYQPSAHLLPPLHFKSPFSPHTGASVYVKREEVSDLFFYTQ